jgi:hypothetical protein
MNTTLTSGRARATRHWLLSFLATPACRGRRLLRATLITTLALNLTAPAWAEIPNNQSPIANPQSPYSNPAVQSALHQLGLPLSPHASVLSPDTSDQFQVNSGTTNAQNNAAIALDSDGDFVVVWQSDVSSGGDTAGTSIQGQRYDSSGTPQGSQFQVNSYTTGNQAFPDVALDSSGNFIVAWQSNGNSSGDTDGYSIQGQRYDSAGAPEPAGQFQVNTFTTNDQRTPALALDNDGDFVVVWNSRVSSSDPDYSIQGQRYDSTGCAVGSQFQVNTYTTNWQLTPDVALDSDGDFVVVWDSNDGSGTDTGGFSIRGQRYNSAGIPQGSQFQINNYTTGDQFNPSVSLDSDGDFVVAWESLGSAGNASIQARRYNSAGLAQGNQFQVESYTTGDQLHPAVALDSDGDFVIVWQSAGSSGDDTAGLSIQGRAFKKTGLPLWSEFQVNSYTSGDQGRPAVAIDSSGDFVVAWHSAGSPGNDSSGDSIQARQLDLGQADHQVNTYTTGSQDNPAVALDSDGDFVIVWQSAGSNGNDSDGNSIQGRRYDSNGQPLADQFQINSYTTGNQNDPAVAMNSDGDFVVVWQSFGSDTGSPADTSYGSIQGQRYDSAGFPQGSQFQVNSYTTNSQGFPALALDSDGDFVVTWQSNGSSTGSPIDTANYSIQARRYNSAGVPDPAGQFQVNTFTTSNQRVPAVSLDAGGDFVITWRSNGSAGDDNNLYSIQAQRYDSSGAPQSGQFQVNNYTTGQQRNPAVALDGDGDFVITWHSVGSDTGTPIDTDFYSIQMRRYNSSGTAQGNQFQVNSYTTTAQVNPAVSLDSDGDFVITWQSYGSSGGDISLWTVQGQRYSSSGTAQGNQFQVNTYTTNDQENPAIALDADGDFLIAWRSDGLTNPPFSNLSQNGEGLENDDDYAIAAARFTAEGAPDPTALTLHTTTSQLPTRTGLLAALLTTLTALLTAATLRLRRRTH